MPSKILMPALSPTMEAGKLERWLKKEGDKNTLEAHSKGQWCWYWLLRY